ncbi:hypothetical protein PHYSODRAFT_251317 [Phytophthora sojae]|uniref:Retrotransposon gag domain-containing protein n=1 Tax=Phytophthora sojae (strain P6497) TaxID=1094619 RepID=G4Z8D9_PHYSP|nr:hypothetical protein PHYSODRAFT_251317 [Phytophthora sojae]EGZ21859.1 hypothetical protein PHYSODRAFT_251317 [Phytophthora sojae]|eukprot:XP_009524576.1 hypothetical protein PHYSODRAFT_251317 [Phytophthora sojae]
MAKGSKSAVPAPVKSGRGSAEGSSTIASDLTSRLSMISERSVSFEESVGEDSDAKYDMMMDYDDLKEKTPATTQEFGDEEDTMQSAGLAKPDHADDDFEDGAETSASRALVQVTRGPQESRGSRPAMNSSTPAANKVLGRMLEQMVELSEWIWQFNPEMTRQATWSELKEELQHPVESTSVTQVAEDTVSLLRAMGCEPRTRPSEVSIKSWTPGLAGKDLHKWKRKLRLSFGPDSGTPPECSPPECSPREGAKVRRAVKQKPAMDGVFSAKTQGSPYFQYSHMVTPRSASRADGIAHEYEGSLRERSTQRSSTRRTGRRFTPHDDSSPDEDNNDNIDYEDGFDSPSDELARQVREGTHTPPNEWCMAFELSFRDGAIHWYRQLPKRTKRQWMRLSDAFIKYYCSQFSQSAKARYYSAKRESSEHLCDYLNRLNGYAGNAGLQFESGGRDAKGHVQWFLEMCSDRSLERRLCHVRVEDIHEREDMINDILKSEERGQSRETSSHHSRSRDQPRRRDDRRHEASRDSHRRDRDRGYERRRDDSCHVPRIPLAEASLSDLVAERQVRGTKGGRAERSSPRRTPYSDSESDASDYHYSESDPSDAALVRKELTLLLPMSANDAKQLKERTRDLTNVNAGVVNPAEDSTGVTATPAETTVMVVRVSTDRAQRVAEPGIRLTTATATADYASRCMTSASAKHFKPSLRSSKRRPRRRTSRQSSKA